MMNGSKPSYLTPGRTIPRTVTLRETSGNLGGSVYRARHSEAPAAGEDPAPPEPAPRDSLSPQRGEGRGEGCDQPRRSFALRALRWLEAKKGTKGPAISGEHRTSNIELPTPNLGAALRPSTLDPRPSFDSSPRPSPRSRRRGSAGGSLPGIRLPAAFFRFRPMSVVRILRDRAGRSYACSIAPRRSSFTGGGA